jgi:tetratricopeptide (TPR) repeat protein
MKAKSKSKVTKKAAARSVARKSIRLKGKTAAASANRARLTGRAPASGAPKRAATMESRRTAMPSAARSTSPPRIRSKQFTSAVQVYEAAIKLMHREEFEKAIQYFEDVISEHSDEPEIQERAKVLIHACEKKVHEKATTVFRSADDHYNVGIADLNRRDIPAAIQHLEHALKLTPKADHVLYALAAANAIQGNADHAISYLKQAVQFRPQNRFLAARDNDFETLQENPDFKHLVTSSEK